MPYDDVASHLSQGHTENSMQAGTLAYKHTSEMFCDYPTGPAEGPTHQPLPLLSNPIQSLSMETPLRLSSETVKQKRQPM